MAPRADFSDATKLIGATEAEVSILIGIHHVVQFGQWHSSTLGSGDGRRQKKKNLDNSVDDQRGCSDSIASSAPTWTSSVKQRQKLNFFIGSVKLQISTSSGRSSKYRKCRGHGQRKEKHSTRSLHTLMLWDEGRHFIPPKLQSSIGSSFFFPPANEAHKPQRPQHNDNRLQL